MLYDSARRPPPSIEELVEAWRYRDLLGQLIGRDVKLRYKRSALGIVWSMLNPLLMMLILTLVFSSVFRFEIATYPVYLLSGTVMWNFLSQSTTHAMTNLRWGGALFSKIYLPRTSFGLSAVGTNLVNFAIALVPLFAIALVLGAPVTAALLWVPVAMALAGLFALGLALILSSLAIAFPDVIDIYQVVLTAWYFLTPIMYPRSIVPEAYRWLVDVNPATYLVEAFRAPVYAGHGPDPVALLIASVVSVATAFVGWTVFAARGDQLAYRL